MNPVLARFLENLSDLISLTTSARVEPETIGRVLLRWGLELTIPLDDAEL